MATLPLLEAGSFSYDSRPLLDGDKAPLFVPDKMPAVQLGLVGLPMHMPWNRLRDHLTVASHAVFYILSIAVPIRENAMNGYLGNIVRTVLCEYVQTHTDELFSAGALDRDAIIARVANLIRTNASQYGVDSADIPANTPHVPRFVGSVYRLESLSSAELVGALVLVYVVDRLGFVIFDCYAHKDMTMDMLKHVMLAKLFNRQFMPRVIEWDRGINAARMSADRAITTFQETLHRRDGAKCWTAQLDVLGARAVFDVMYGTGRSFASIIDDLREIQRRSVGVEYYTSIYSIPPEGNAFANHKHIDEYLKTLRQAVGAYVKRELDNASPPSPPQKRARLE